MRRWTYYFALLVYLLATVVGVVAQTDEQIPVHYQRFEQGFIILEPETGTAYVFSLHDFSAYVASSLNYADTPLSNDNSPDGLRIPQGNIGRVWAELELQETLGYALGESVFYSAVITETENYRQFRLPDGVPIVLVDQSRWNYGTTPRSMPPPVALDAKAAQLNSRFSSTATQTPSPTPTLTPSLSPRSDNRESPEITNRQPTRTTDAVYQNFENGFMIWLKDTDDIFAFNTTRGYASWYFDYRDLPENSVTQDTPPGRIKPVHGFGKVWENYDLVDSLGWAVSGEQFYTTEVAQQTFFPRNTIIYITHPLIDGTVRLDYYTGQWSALEGSPVDNAEADATGR